MLDVQAVNEALAADPDWLAQRRRDAFASFDAQTAPSPDAEIWRHLDLDVSLADFAPATIGTAPMSGDPLAERLTTTASVRVVDGAAVSDGIRGDGFALTGLAEAVARDDPALRATLEQVVIPPATDQFAAAHEAFGSEGALASVAAGVALEHPLYVDVQSVSPGTVSFPRIVVAAGAGAEASVVVHLRSPDDCNVLVVPRLLVATGPNAAVDVTMVQNWGDATRSLAHAKATVAADGRCRLTEFGLGARLSRLHLMVDLLGRGSAAEILGGYFGDRDQTLDYRYFIRHVGLNTRSDMLLKGAVEDAARSVFTGMIRIEDEAQKAEAFQTNRNLILSEGAAALSVPNLEILANDVRCGHGSTVGPLDRDQRYYLMSRGLTPQRADRLQVHGFFEQVLRKVSPRELRAPVRDWINAKYVGAQDEGRL